MIADRAAEGTADELVELGPYRLEGVLGYGGTDEVRRAYDRRRGRVVALRILPPELTQDEDFRTRFRRECDAAARLHDPHVVAIHDFGEIDGRLFVDMQLVDGVALDRLLAAGPLDPQRAVALVEQVADALTEAHVRGVVHRDVRPANILVTPSDFTYVVGFGVPDDDRLAAAHRGHGSAGALPYTAPERFDAAPADHRGDVYALACMLVECLTGRRPFPATGVRALRKAHRTAVPPRPGKLRPELPRALDDVIARGMAKDPADRYESARELATAARDALREPDRHGAAAAGPVPASLPRTALQGTERQETAQPKADAADSARKAPAAALGSRGRTTLGLVAAALVLVTAAGGTGFALGRTFDPADAAAPPAPAAPRPGPDAAAGPAVSYVYSVESNYPVSLTYIDGNGDQTSVASTAAPWSLTVDSAAWGADATPSLTVGSDSTKGDTWVSCAITDSAGQVLAQEIREAAFASAVCAVSG